VRIERSARGTPCVTSTSRGRSRTDHLVEHPPSEAAIERSEALRFGLSGPSSDDLRGGTRRSEIPKPSHETASDVSDGHRRPEPGESHTPSSEAESGGQEITRNSLPDGVNTAHNPKVAVVRRSLGRHGVELRISSALRNCGVRKQSHPMPNDSWSTAWRSKNQLVRDGPRPSSHG
jgi:hypothetical protein